MVSSSPYRFASRVARLGFSPSQAMMQRVAELRRQGRKIIDFGSKPDTAEHVKAAARRHLETDAAARYTDPRGMPELRQAIATKLEAENGIAVDPDREITVTTGGKFGILAALLALVGPGDEVLLEDPGWLSFEPMVRIAGAQPVPVPLREADGFGLSADALEKRVTRQTRLIILCNPHNPTGRVLGKDELRAIARVVLDHDLLVLVDEAYEHFIYDGRQHVSLASLRGMKARTITAQTASKVHNMFGWRVGWIAAAPAISAKIQTVVSHSITCATSFAQAGAAAALSGPIGLGNQSIAAIVEAYERQRNALVGGLSAIEGIACAIPMGAYFAFANMKRFGRSSEDLAISLLEEAGIATTPGSAFGRRGEGYLRFVFNAPVAEIEEGVARLREHFQGTRR